MPEKITNTSSPRKGMNRDKNPIDLTETEYPFSLNSNIASDNGDTFLIQNEPSNLLCANFPQGFVVVGREYNVNTNRTYFFLTNDTTKVSEIGHIEGNINITNVDDLENVCNCNITNILAEPLEGQAQQPTCTYTTLVNDSCNLCLRFNKNRPIRKIVVKYESTGTTLWWTDNTAIRYLKVDDIEEYLFTGDITCGEDNTTPTCLDCEKLRVFKESEQLVIRAESIQQGGRLPAGVIEVLVAYSDLQGNEISSYYSITNPISIFDENNTIISQPELEALTNYAIRLSIDNVDISYPYYKVGIIYTGGINGTSYYDGGVYSTSDREVVITTLQDLQRTTLNRITVPKKTYEKADGVTSSNGSIFWYGTTEQEEINFQPCANLLGQFLRWQTVESTEDLYKDGVNNSLYKTYMRDEVYPFAIQLLFDNGYVSSDFPLINRPPTPDELSVVDNMDTQSVLKYGKNCSVNDRNKKWQFYNTATEEGFYDGGSSDNYTTVERETKKNCIVKNVYLEDSLTLQVPCDTIYTNLFSYISQFRSSICDTSSPYYNSDLCAIVSNTYPDQACDTNELFGNSCDLPAQLVDGSIQIYLETVEDEDIEREFIEVDDMLPTQQPQFCNIYKPGTNEFGYEEDTTFEASYMPVGESVYKRNNPGANTDCIYPATLTATPTLSFLDYGGSLVLADLQTDRTSTASGDFTAFVHTKSLWYKIVFGEQDSIVFEISKKSDCDNTDNIPIGSQIRFTTFNDCATTAHTYSQIVDLSAGELLQLNKADYPSGTVLIALDSPIDTKTIVSGVSYVISPPCGCFYVLNRPLECAQQTVTITNAAFSKSSTYLTQCEYNVPVNTSCEPAPYKYGKFGYWESENTYPDNEELYNSANLQIDFNLLPSQYEAEFRNNYFQDGVLNADFRCQPIRHYRFPDFSVAPYMSTESLTPFSQALIYPIGISIDEDIINFFLDVAVTNGLLTQAQRDKVVGYKIKAGDRTLHKSIIAKGLAYDMYKYTEVGSSNPDPILFPNFPYNDNSENELLHENLNRNSYIQHPTSGISNNNFTFHSPDTSFSKPTIPTELKVEAYHAGTSRGVFAKVEDHVREVVLGKDAYTIATTLGILEATFELATNIADFTINASANTYTIYFAGTGSTGVGQNFVGAGVSAAALAVYIGASVAATALKVGQYRKQWLDIISDLGQPRNFASFYTSVGDYNYGIANPTQGNQLRAIKTKKYLKEGTYDFTEEQTGEPIKINNLDRESSVFLSTGKDYPISYLPQTLGLDDSRAIASESVGCENKSISSVLERGVASPYVSLRNYLSSQYGNIGDIKWIQTGYTGDLRNTQQFPQIFGGDTFISRFSFKRKHPIFTTTAMNFADRTPFNYTTERNVGVPRFYADFLAATEDGNLGNALFPDVATDYNFDCLSGVNSSYVKEPSKFYLYYYGIPYFLVESEINLNYRFGREGLENNFYPNIGDYIKWTQETNVPIGQDNTYNYNNVYSKRTTQILNKSLPIDYNSEYFRKIIYQPNQVFWSLPDNSDLNTFEPWLAYKPLDFHLFKQDNGLLIDIADIESQQVLTRFENGFRVDNTVDVLRERITPETQALGTAGIFSQRPREFKKTKLGYAGTQHAELVSCEFGHFWVDAKRGQVFQVDQNGEQLKDITPGITRWFKNQLPFKLLKSIPEAEVDNSYNGIGITMAWDSKNKRVFLTKKDYIPLLECIQYDEELGYVRNETLCGAEPIINCPEGYTYNEETQMCEIEVSTNLCPEGYNYDPIDNRCIKVTSTILDPCPPYLGYYTGGAFTAPDARILNSQINLPNINNGAVRIIKRDVQGRILVGGIFSSAGAGTYTGLIRLNVNGTIDSTFNANGFAGGAVSITCLDIYEDGRIVVGGDFRTYKGNNAQGLVRMFENGDYDSSFNTQVGFDIRNPWDVRIVEGEKVLVATEQNTYKGQDSKGLIKLNTDATIDGTFSGGDRFKSFVYADSVNGVNGTGNGQQRCESIEIDSEGRYIIGGRFIEYNGVLSRKLVRIFPNGNIDTSFAVGEGFLFQGIARIRNYVIKVQMQGDKILVGGRFDSYKGQPAQGIVRILSNGDLDSTFNNSKEVTGSDSSDVERSIQDFDIDVDGNILMGGDYQSYDGNGVKYFTLTDSNGFLVPFVDPGYNALIQAVLNTPRCQQCEAPCYTINNTCNCEEYAPAKSCSGEDCDIIGQQCQCTVSVEPTQEDVLTPIDINDETYFKDVSWTVAYSPLTESWISYYSFKPNYYISHQDYFQSGLNNVTGSLWSHLLTNRSYQVFYGNKYPWIVEVPEKPSLDNKVLSNINFIVDSERYQNEYDTAPWPKIGFNEMVIYNQTNNSGRIKLTAEDKNNLYQKIQYPITTTDSQDVLVTKYNDKFRVNYFFNRIKSENNNLIHWIKDDVDVEKEINLDNITYRSPLPERMRGNYFLVRYYKTEDTQIKSIFKFQIDEDSVTP